jgi:hypothetical protein
MRKIATSLGIVTLLSLGGNASAAKWHWEIENVSPGNKVCAKSVADTYVLGCTSTPQGNSVWRKVSYNNWTSDGGAKGMSITQAVSGGKPWVVGFNNSLWYRESNGWFAKPNNTCEGGSAVVRKVLGEKSIAVGSYNNVEQPYYVEDGTANNTVRWWNGSCWQRLPTLPQSSVREIGIYSAPAEILGNRNGWPWALSHQNTIYLWAGHSGVWVPTIGGASAIGSTGTSYQILAGSDLTSLWSYSASTGLTKDASWTFGTIQELGTNRSGAADMTVLRPNGDLYRWVFN